MDMEQSELNINNKNDSTTNLLLSSILIEMKKARKDMASQVNEAELVKLKWRDVADMVNTILCGVYIFTAMVLSAICIGFWSHG